MEFVQEGSSNAAVTIEFVDRNGKAVVPSSASYKVLGRETTSDSWSELVATTAISSLDTSVDVELVPPATTFIGSGPKEYRRLCVYVDSLFWKHFSFYLVKSLCA